MNRRQYLIEQITNLVVERLLENSESSQKPFFGKGLKRADIGTPVQQKFQNLIDTLVSIQKASVGEKEVEALGTAVDGVLNVKGDLVLVLHNVSKNLNEATLPLEDSPGYIPGGVAIPPSKEENLMDDVDAVNVREFLAAEFDSIANFMMQQADMIRNQLGNTFVSYSTEIYELVERLRGIQKILNMYTLQSPVVDRESLKLKSGYLARKARVEYGGKSTPRPGVFAIKRDRYE